MAVFGTSEYRAIVEQLTQPGPICLAQLRTLGIRCLDCQLRPGSDICLPCYFAGQHTNHRIILRRGLGGFCACGDYEAWKPECFCKRHSGVNAVTDSAAILESLPTSLPSVPDFVSNVTEVLKFINDNEINPWIGKNKKLDELDILGLQLLNCLDWLTEFASITPAFQYLIGKHVLYESRVREFLVASLLLPEVVSFSFERLVLVAAGLPSYKMMLAKILFEELPALFEKQRDRCCSADEAIRYLRQFCNMMVPQIFTAQEVANEAFSKCLVVKLVQEFEKTVKFSHENRNSAEKERELDQCLLLRMLCSRMLLCLMGSCCPESFFHTEGSFGSILNLFALFESLSHQMRRRISHGNDRPDWHLEREDYLFAAKIIERVNNFTNFLFMNVLIHQKTTNAFQ